MVAAPADWSANHEVRTQEHKQTSGKAKAVKQKQKQSYKSAITRTTFLKHTTRCCAVKQKQCGTHGEVRSHFS
jgi:hypothetical protein